jgi:hypothetical protein
MKGVQGMKSIAVRASLATAMLALGLSAAQAAEIKWAKSYDAAVQAAKSSNKLVMADFYTDW